MTYSDTTKIMAVIEAAYPRYYAEKTTAEKKDAVAVWYASLKEYEYEIVGTAVRAIIRTLKYPPSIADIVEMIINLTTEKGMSELEAWEYVSRALKNSIYGYKEEYDKLPEDVKRAIRRPETLKAWAMLDVDEVNTVIQSNFMRTFRAEQKRHNEWQKYPMEVKALISSIGVKRLNGGKTDG